MREPTEREVLEVMDALLGFYSKELKRSDDPADKLTLRQVRLEAEKACRAFLSVAATPPTTASVHTDHPLRHWDRTCPACIAESAVNDSAAIKAETKVVWFVENDQSEWWIGGSWQFATDGDHWTRDPHKARHYKLEIDAQESCDYLASHLGPNVKPTGHIFLESAQSESGKQDTAKVQDGMVLVPIGLFNRILDAHQDASDALVDVHGDEHRAIVRELLAAAPSPSGVEESK